jgi:primosomal protein N''
MFFSHGTNRALEPIVSVQKQSEKKITETLSTSFDEKLLSMKKQLLDAGIPEDEHDQFLAELKTETEVKVIEEFHERVLDRAKQDAANRFTAATNIVESDSSPSRIKARALFDLYHFYSYGWGVVTADQERAKALLTKAVELGNCAASYELSRMYLDQRNFDSAERLIRSTIALNNDNDDEGDLALLTELKNLLTAIPTLKSMFRQNFRLSMHAS